MRRNIHLAFIIFLSILVSSYESNWPNLCIGTCEDGNNWDNTIFNEGLNPFDSETLYLDLAIPDADRDFENVKDQFDSNENVEKINFQFDSFQNEMFEHDIDKVFEDPIASFYDEHDPLNPRVTEPDSPYVTEEKDQGSLVGMQTNPDPQQNDKPATPRPLKRPRLSGDPKHHITSNTPRSNFTFVDQRVADLVIKKNLPRNNKSPRSERLSVHLQKDLTLVPARPPTAVNIHNETHLSSSSSETKERSLTLFVMPNGLTSKFPITALRSNPSLEDGDYAKSPKIQPSTILSSVNQSEQDDHLSFIPFQYNEKVSGPPQPKSPESAAIKCLHSHVSSKRIPTHPSHQPSAAHTTPPSKINEFPLSFQDQSVVGSDVLNLEEPNIGITGRLNQFIFRLRPGFIFFSDSQEYGNDKHPETYKRGFPIMIMDESLTRLALKIKQDGLWIILKKADNGKTGLYARVIGNPSVALKVLRPTEQGYQTILQLQSGLVNCLVEENDLVLIGETNLMRADIHLKGADTSTLARQLLNGHFWVVCKLLTDH